MKYPIASIFRSLQGEGHFRGYPATFVRLAGCSVLDCMIRRECDEAPWKMTEMLTVDEILLRVRQGSPDGIVVITGGEPTDHDLIPLVDAIHSTRSLRVHIETSGARAAVGIPVEWITVSPKTADYVIRTAHTMKLIVRPGMTWRDIAAFDEGTAFFHRYLQPLTMPDGSNNKREVIDLLLAWDNKDGRWALSTQGHKEWGVP